PRRGGGPHRGGCGHGPRPRTGARPRADRGRGGRGQGVVPPAPPHCRTRPAHPVPRGRGVAMRVVILVGAGSGATGIPARWEHEHDVTIVSLPSRLARLRGRRGPVVVDASRWILPLWAGLSPRARRALRAADLVVAADTTA